MLFNSFEFLVFLPIVFLLYWFVFNRSLKLQNLFVVIASYVFYGWWNWRFLILIVITSFLSWGSGMLMMRVDFESENDVRNRETDEIENKRKIITIVNIVINFLILATFKYYNFFVKEFANLFHLSADSVLLNLILPVGISFYTFQALSYSIDVYKRKIEPTKDIIQFFAYVSFFPQLVAGPIERATNLLPQFKKERVFDYNIAVDGCRQILWGLFKKIVVADTCAIVVNEIFADYADKPAGVLLVGAVCFTFQIYGDFSGYSDIAIGTAKLFGIKLMQNFNVPYFSRDVGEFWRRWHISLTTWFRDYVYIPLGGSRTTKLKIFRNIFIVFILSALWHGANWTYITWGAYHVLLFSPLILTGRNRRYTNIVAAGKKLPSIKEFLQMVFTFVLVTFGWIIFRSDTIRDAWQYICSICDKNVFLAVIYFFTYPKYYSGFFVGIMIVVEWLQRGKQHGMDMGGEFFSNSIFRWGIYICIVYLIIFVIGFVGKSEFIYFQF